MSSFIADDINALLKLKKGDSKHLNYIKKICENNQLISISDRKYVERLALQYLHKKEKQKPIRRDSPANLAENADNEVINDKKIDETKDLKSNELKKETVDVAKTISQNKISSHSMEITSKKKIILGIVAIALAIIVMATVSIGENSVFVVDQIREPTINELVPPYITIVSDEIAYDKADIISISGESNPIIIGTVRISIKNVDEKVVWAENVNVKDDGKFSTLLIAGGDGWGGNGKYTLIVEHDSLKSQINFDFVN